MSIVSTIKKRLAAVAVGVITSTAIIATVSAASVDQIAILCPPLGTVQAHFESGTGAIGVITWGYNTKTLLPARTGHILATATYDPTFWFYQSGTLPTNFEATAVVCYPQTYCEFSSAVCIPPLTVSPAAVVDRVAQLLRVAP
jgi:hypothetical protein